MTDFEKGTKTQGAVDADHQWNHEDDPVIALAEQIQATSVQGDAVVESAKADELEEKPRKGGLREMMEENYEQAAQGVREISKTMEAVYEMHNNVTDATLAEVKEMARTIGLDTSDEKEIEAVNDLLSN